MRRRYRKIPKDHGDLRAICGGESCDRWMSIILAWCKNFTQHLPGVWRAARTRPWVIALVLFQPVGTGRGADPKNSESRWPGNMPEFYKNNFQTSKEKGLATAPSAHPKSALGQSLSVARSLLGDSALWVAGPSRRGKKRLLQWHVTNYIK